MKLNPNTQENGFTLVEVLVVLLIIGILAAVAVPAYLEQRKAAFEAVLKSDLRNIGQQITETHDFDNGGFREPVVVTDDNTTVADPQKYEPVFLSKGVSISYKTTPEGFCVTGIHDSDPANAWGYSSSTGGLTKNTMACAAGLDVPTEQDDDTTPTGDIFADDPLDVQCFAEMMAINRTFNEALEWRTPESMMSYIAYMNIDGYGDEYWYYYESHPDTITKFELLDELEAVEQLVFDDEAMNTEYRARNRAMYTAYDTWREPEMMFWYYGVIEDEIRKGADPRGIPTQRMRDAYNEYVRYVHQWNYIQCGEYAYPGNANYTSIWPYAMNYTPRAK